MCFAGTMNKSRRYLKVFWVLLFNDRTARRSPVWTRSIILRQSQTPLAFAAIILLTLNSILLFYAIEMLEKRFVTWKRDFSAPQYVCVWADGIFLQARMEDSANACWCAGPDRRDGSVDA